MTIQWFDCPIFSIPSQEDYYFLAKIDIKSLFKFRNLPGIVSATTNHNFK